MHSNDTTATTTRSIWRNVALTADGELIGFPDHLGGNSYGKTSVAIWNEHVGRYIPHCSECGSSIGHLGSCTVGRVFHPCDAHPVCDDNDDDDECGCYYQYVGPEF
jgi:hypothetical protein